MHTAEEHSAACKLLIISDGNLLDDSVEASGYRALCQSLGAHGSATLAGAYEAPPSAR